MERLLNMAARKQPPPLKEKPCPKCEELTQALKDLRRLANFGNDQFNMVVRMKIDEVL